MKKTLALLLAFVMCLSLYACGGKEETPAQQPEIIYDVPVNGANQIGTTGVPAELIGKWVNKSTMQVIAIDSAQAILNNYNMTSGGMSGMISVYPGISLSGNKVTLDGIGSFTLSGDKMVCESGIGINPGMEFVKGRDLYTMNDLTAHKWVNNNNGFALWYEMDTFYFDMGSNMGGSYQCPGIMCEIADNMLYGLGIPAFEIVEENGTLKLICEHGEFLPEGVVAAQSQNYTLGETASAEAATITLTSVDFVTNLTAETASRFMAEDRGWTSGGMIAGDEKVFARVFFDYTNMAKQEIDMTDIIKVTVDYNDGYCYSTDDGFSFCLNGDGVYRQFGATGYVLDLAPLESDSFLVCIPVMEIVGKDTTSPMKVLFEIKSETGVQTVGFTVR